MRAERWGLLAAAGTKYVSLLCAAGWQKGLGRGLADCGPCPNASLKGIHTKKKNRKRLESERKKRERFHPLYRALPLLN